jgi:predicted CoA-substrate-specific enzyme activase
LRLSAFSASSRDTGIVIILQSKERPMQKNLYLGIDIGSVSIKIALIDEKAVLQAEIYTVTKGDPAAVLNSELSTLAAKFPERRVRAAAITGSGGKQVASVIGARFINEILAQSVFAGHFHPAARSIIEMGGEDAKLINLLPDAVNGGVSIEDFSMNTACAAGTGSFLDQQAARLHLTIEQFSRIALRSEKPPRVAGRCSVFAKSDMIHLQQIATPDYDIVAGLCYAMARNFKATVGKGKKFRAPLLFLGGVAANAGMHRAFRDVLRLSESDMTVPGHFNTSGAIGAALIVMKQPESAVPYRGIAALTGYLASTGKRVESGVSPLSAPCGIMPNPGQDAASGPGGLIEAYLGVDVGSVSTNVVVIDRQMRVLSKRYLPTAGRPIEAVKQGLAEVGDEIGSRVKILGAGTTGSGRYLTGDMIGADVVRNEITAQATAAAAIDPVVDTIFEIGGQDSKFISLRGGAVVDFEMNKACAAGTGSFLEEQAERLGIRIKSEFEDRALRAASPCRFGERCTVFMESDLVHSMNSGAGVEELTAGLAYSIAYNYLNKVVAGKHVGERIFFQGGVAANRAVVAAFETITGKQVTVPPHHEVTGAIGVAILAMQSSISTSSFKGFDLSKRSYAITTFECAECANRCDIKRVCFDGEKPLFYGSRCEKYDVKKKNATAHTLPDLFVEREELLASAVIPGSVPDTAPTVGIPRMLYINDYLPYWRTFFGELGYRVVLSERTNRTLVNRAIEASAAETCFPAKVAIGHIQDLLDKKVDVLFVPSFIQFPASHGQPGNSQACPYAQALPYIARASIKFGESNVIEPILLLRDERHFEKSMLEIGKVLGKSRGAVKRAQRLGWEAQERYYAAAEKRGGEVLSALKPGEKALVLVGRNYNTCDTGVNMNLPSKVRDLGFHAIPMDFLPLHQVDLSDQEHMYWRSGQKIMAAARTIRGHKNLYPLYITNFGCGPDSFITHFFRQEMGGKPFLQLEIDEHSADAGAITRIEAFLDSLNNVKEDRPAASFAILNKSNGNGSLRPKKVYFPPMTDHAFALAAAFRACGVEAEVLPESDDETVRIGREHTSGRECYPLALTTGDMIKATRRPGFEPDQTAFFMPTGRGPCRFGQYHRYHRQVLDKLGLERVKILAPMQDESLHDDVSMFDKDFVLMSWRGAYAVDMLQKALWEHRPYEKQQGLADRVYRTSLDRLTGAIEKREDLLPVLRQSYEDFIAIDIADRSKPVIGVVGEIYIRSNRFSNEDVVRQIERLGGEAWVAPISEWLLYVNNTAKASAKMNRSLRDLFKAYLTQHVQHRDERRFLSGFNGSMRSLREPSIEQTLRAARPYIHHSFEGEAVLSVGKAIDYINRGVSGIVNVMPFTCMPGTIATAVLKRVREEHDNIPLLNIAYEGQGDSQTVTRLEAFMHQARSYQATKKSCIK